MKSKDIEVKSHMSILEENQEKLGKSSLKNTAEQNKEAEKKEKPVEENVEKKPKKKSNIIQVYRPQNAMTQEGKNFRRGGKQQRPEGARQESSAGGRPSARPARRARCTSGGCKTGTAGRENRADAGTAASGEKYRRPSGRGSPVQKWRGSSGRRQPFLWGPPGQK